MHAGQLAHGKLGLSGPVFQFGGPNQFAIFMGAPWQQVKHILGPDNGKQPRLGVAIDGREKHRATWFH